MDNNTFLAEIHEYIETSYKQFEYYQGIAFDILCEFDRVCRENDIPYFLAYGTLLGAVRDNDLIPWDYDIDVQVYFKDKDRFIDALKNTLGSEFYYAYYDNTPRYPAYCLRIGKKGHHFNALHVDVFFLIGCPDEEKEQNKFLVRLNKYCEKRLRKYSFYWFGNTCTKLGKIRNQFDAFRAFFISKKKLDIEEKWLTTAYPIDKYKYCCSLARENKPYLKESYANTEEVDIRGRKMFIPAGYKDVLDMMYKGQWNSYLPIQNRFEEYYNMLKTIKEREQ